MTNNSLLPLQPPFTDLRGSITNLVTDGIQSVAVITSTKGSIRSNHYHLHNSHYLYVISGKVKYYERDLDGSNITIQEYESGQMFYTTSHKVHKVEFLDDTVLVSLAPQSNAPSEHDKDTIHQEF